MDEERFAAARRRMVEYQIEARGVRDRRVLAAMREIPRHFFVPDSCRDASYDDRPLPIGEGQTISQPYLVALMTELLALSPDDRVLEIGTGSGYQAAILSRLAAGVISVERLPGVAKQAEENLAKLSITNVRIVVGDGTLGVPEHAPYDAVIITAATPRIPPPLVEQLAEGGRLVAPVGSLDLQTLLKVEKREGRTVTTDYGGVRFVPLIGSHGWDI
jgi:protein-L-isoaspartate(D-aspartate) O-methyltransferase